MTIAALQDRVLALESEVVAAQIEVSNTSALKFKVLFVM
jgi:hypothetical protein